MAITLNAKELTNVEIAADGDSFKLHFADEAGRATAVNLPTDSLNALILTLPTILDRAMKLRHRDDTLRMVYPLGNYQVERAAGTDQYILTLRTADGFGISFVMSEATVNDMADSVNQDAVAGTAERDRDEDKSAAVGRLN